MSSKVNILYQISSSQRKVAAEANSVAVKRHRRSFEESQNINYSLSISTTLANVGTKYCVIKKNNIKHFKNKFKLFLSIRTKVNHKKS